MLFYFLFLPNSMRTQKMHPSCYLLVLMAAVKQQALVNSRIIIHNKVKKYCSLPLTRSVPLQQNNSRNGRVSHILIFYAAKKVKTRRHWCIKDAKNLKMSNMILSSLILQDDCKPKQISC